MKTANLFLVSMIVLSFTLLTQKSKAMERKTVEETTVLKYTLKSSLATLTSDIGEIPNELMAKAAELKLEIKGSQIWIYEGSDGNPQTKFNLSICIPVKAANIDAGKFEVVTLNAFDCIFEIHKGSWQNLGNTYQKMIGEMTRKSLIPAPVSREIYLQCDFENQENNITEVQLGVQ